MTVSSLWLSYISILEKKISVDSKVVRVENQCHIGFFLLLTSCLKALLFLMGIEQIFVETRLGSTALVGGIQIASKVSTCLERRFWIPPLEFSDAKLRNVYFLNV